MSTIKLGEQLKKAFERHGLDPIDDLLFAITVLGIVRDWVHSIDKDCLVYFKGNVETATIDQITISKPNCIGDKVGLTIIHKENNVRFRLGVYQNKYSTEEVQERGNK